jgi:hypothetical protein
MHIVERMGEIISNLGYSVSTRGYPHGRTRGVREAGVRRRSHAIRRSWDKEKKME